MPDIRIHREHTLGLQKAREIAWQWADEVEARFGMSCAVNEGDFSDTVEFSRTGVSGELVVAGDHFDLRAKLGFLLGAFARTIEKEILQNLDDLLGQAGQAAKASKARPAAKAPAPKSAAARSPAAKRKPVR
jgi:putative polyhydroxyalkanoate system protein